MMPHRPPQQRVVVRSVWAWNLEHEFSIIASVVRRFPFVAFDTEFPGLVYRSREPQRLLSPHQRYAIFKANVDRLQLIQLGLTLFDAHGDLPDLGTGGEVGFVWEFNFREFDVRRDLHAPDSIQLLRSSGIDFDRLRLDGIDACRFAVLLYRSGLVAHCPRCPGRVSAQWIAFGSCYDFGFLIKALRMRRCLPNRLEEFLTVVYLLFGKVLDVKYMMRHCDGLYGGLESVARKLKVARAAGSSHQAGSDSLLACKAFLKMKEVFFDGEDDELAQHVGVIYGLQAC